jgi:GAF domain-containing protein
VSTGDVRSRSQLLAGMLLDDVEQIAERSAARMQELLPSYAKVPRHELVPLTLANARNVLEAIRDADQDRRREHRSAGTGPAGPGITPDEMLHAWRIGLEGVREAAYAVAEEREIGQDALLEFVEATLRWGDGAMRASASAQHEAELRELGRLAREQAALRRVATMVAGESSPEEVFAKVAQEVASVLDAETAAIDRYDADGGCTVVGSWGTFREAFPVGTRWQLRGDTVGTMVYRTGRPARTNSYAEVTGTIAAAARHAGLHSAVASPIIVNGRLWGVIAVATSQPEPMPADTESRITQFTELVATAISNVQAREEAKRLADEQAALRRVAMLVARESSPEEVFTKVAEEVGVLVNSDAAAVLCYEADQRAMVVGNWGALAERLPVGSRVTLDPYSVSALVYRTQRPARFAAYEMATSVAAGAREVGLRSAVGSPIFVNGRLWGVIAAATALAETMPADAESRIAQFTELVATAISNIQAREEVKRLADEQVALRRVATLVARESSPEEVFTKVAEEVVLLLGAESAMVERYEPDGDAVVVGSWAIEGARGLLEARRDAWFRPGHRWRPPDGSITSSVNRTARPARLDDDGHGSASTAVDERQAGRGSAVGSPIVVNGRVWGAIVAATSRAEPLPADAEARIAQFTELVATAISNLQTRSDLAASRARIVAAADDERRRVVRDLHDGAQQRLVHTVVTLKLAGRALERDRDDAAGLVDAAIKHAQTAIDELRELSHGILPSVLTSGGLGAGVRALAAKMPIPVDIDVRVGPLPGAVEATAYFVVAEALTNVAKHAQAEVAAVTARLEMGVLRLKVTDDGVGGAEPAGAGLVGLRDRLAVLDGSLRIESPTGNGTIVQASIPVSGS